MGVFGQPLFDLLSRGRFATLWWARLLLVLLALGMVTWRGVRRWPGQVALVATALALLTSSFNSHGAALLSGAYLGVAADWFHFLGVAAWIGGLLSLMYVLPVAVRASQAAGDRVLAQAVSRLSKLALVAVCVIVVTGTFQAWLEVGSWEGFVQTAYGLSVTAKIGLLVVMLLLAASNLLIVRPGLARMAASGSAAAASELARRFSFAVRGEVALAVVVLLKRDRGGAPAPSCQCTGVAASLDASVMAEVGPLPDAVMKADPALPLSPSSGLGKATAPRGPAQRGGRGQGAGRPR